MNNKTVFVWSWHSPWQSWVTFHSAVKWEKRTWGKHSSLLTPSARKGQITFVHIPLARTVPGHHLGHGEQQGELGLLTSQLIPGKIWSCGEGARRVQSANCHCSCPNGGKQISPPLFFSNTQHLVLSSKNTTQLPLITASSFKSRSWGVISVRSRYSSSRGSKHWAKINVCCSKTLNI